VWFTKRNNGVYEPEMRLYFAIFPALVGPAGLFLYGYSTAAVSYPSFVPLHNASVLTEISGDAMDRALCRCCNVRLHNHCAW
jgi:hypothetical protein